MIDRAPRAALAVAAVAAGWFLAHRRTAGPRLELRAGEPAPAPQPREPWQCACGQEYLVAGRDRHRIYWPAGADEGDPVLSGECRECGRTLAHAGRSTT